MEKLEMIVSSDEVWSATALEMAANGSSLREQIQISGQQIVDCVTAGHLAVDELRDCVRWTSGLARQAVQAAERGTGWGEAERLEITARQILHGSVSAALNKVRTEGRLTTQRAQSSRRRQGSAVAMPGMANQEKKDRPA
ncbi:MAG TPA: hypothetical protein VHC21_02210 [Candidatus Saccharimonadales bacterium]|nr:hypothetical protein [Candidatus Saccharimonadales bacterium]